ncbi:MAG: NfeD family protein [Gammaproteobacteria bacterium]|nr:NfeD family protein [Gammaproteobacteria bacterium]
MINIVQDWHWWVIGTLLIVLNALSRSVILTMLGLAAIIIGFILTIDPFFPVKHQMGGFVMLAMTLILISSLLNKGNLELFPKQGPLNEGPGKEHIGKTYTLEVPMFEGSGTLNIEGKIWPVDGRDLDKGTKVRVIGCRGETLLVVDEKAAQKFEAEKAKRAKESEQHV